ncbi:hypothetical protein [Hardygib1 virus]|nr:hypothetical protein [Hardygib1 virus]
MSATSISPGCGSPLATNFIERGIPPDDF